MNKIILVFFCLLVSNIAFSQFNIGPRVGLGTVFTNVETTSEQIKAGDAQFGFSLGLFGRFGSNKFMVMPELLYSTSTTNIKFDNNTTQEIFESKLNKVDVPINLVIRPTNAFNINGGLVGSYIVNSTNNINETSQEAVKNVEDFTLGYQAGVGAEFANFLLDLKYEGALSDVTNENRINNFEFDERESMIKLILGVKLF